MHEAYRSGKAQVEFLADVASRKAALHEAQTPAAVPVHPALPSSKMTVDVNGQAYKVTVSYGDTTNTPVQSGNHLPLLQQHRLPEAECYIRPDGIIIR